jgi:hypothetical protein
MPLQSSSLMSESGSDALGGMRDEIDEIHAMLNERALLVRRWFGRSERR